MTDADVDALLRRRRAAPDGSYRVVASKALDGKPVGPFRYYGTRPDDPNDIVPHEHRRELRALRVFGAWLNHDDSRGINTLDFLRTRAAARSCATTCSTSARRSAAAARGPEARAPATSTSVEAAADADHDDHARLLRAAVDEGALPRPAGRRPFRGQLLPARAMEAGYPNPAFDNARPEDLFWGARILAALSDDGVRAIVGTAKYSDSKATDYLTTTLLTRKHKVVRSWLNATNPIVNPVASAAGELTFENAAQTAGVGPAAERYTIQWSTFDNASSTHTDVGAEQTVTSPAARAPEALLTARPEYIGALLRAYHADQPAWSRPLMVYFRRSGETWALVGLERN